MRFVGLLGVASASTVPTVLWSSGSRFGKNVQEFPTTVSTEYTAKLVQDLLAGNKHEAVTTFGDEAPKNAVVFLDMDRSTKDFGEALGGELSFVAESAKNGAVTFPYTTPDNLYEHFPESDRAFFDLKSGGNFTETFGAKGLPKVLFIELGDAKALKSVQADLAATGGDYLGVYTSSMAPQARQLTSMVQLNAGPLPKVAGAALLINPPIMSGLLIGIVWLSIFFAGFCCLFGIQTPVNFEEKVLAINKEY